MAQRTTSMRLPNAVQSKNAIAVRPKQAGLVARPQRVTLSDVANSKKPTVTTKTTVAPAAVKPVLKPRARLTRTTSVIAPKTATAPIAEPVELVAPKQEEKPDIESLSAAFSSKILQVTDIDENDENDPFLLPQYVNDIYEYLRSLEKKSQIKYNFLSGKLVDGRMRGILVDWLVQVHARFSLLQETLFLAVAIVDLYLQDTLIPKEKLQLVGVSALYIASKYEEIYAPGISDFVYISDYTYTTAEILKMERDILRKLDFGLGRPSALHFLRRNTKAAAGNAKQHTMAKYFIELALVEYSFAHYDPSLMAAASTYLSLKLDKVQWTDTLAHYSKYSEADVVPLARKLALLITRASTKKLQAVTAKYASEKLMKVSASPQLHSSIMLKMASEAD